MTKEKCPICGKDTDKEFKPFCSKRCADIDLYRWLEGKYAIPTNEYVSNDNQENNQEEE